MSREKLTKDESRQLCLQIRLGDRKAFKELYKRTESQVILIVRYGYRGADINSDIDETIQETILRVYKVIGITSDYDEAIENFAGLVAKGKWRDHLRKQVTYQKHLDQFAQERDRDVENDMDHIKQQFRSLMAISAKELPRCHPLFILCYELELPITEIAEQLDSTPNNISAKLTYCRKRLLEKIENQKS